MARRPYPFSEKYLGNKSTKEVHDLDKETNNCQINEIIASGNAVPFSTLAAAKSAGYDNCHWCLGGSTR